MYKQTTMEEVDKITFLQSFSDKYGLSIFPKGYGHGFVVLILGLLVFIMGATALSPEDQANSATGATIAFLLLFFAICIYCDMAKGLVGDFFGVKSLLYVGALLLLNVALTTEVTTFKLKRSVEKRAQFSDPGPVGMLLTLGGGSLIFGFLDNFGMKLGTDALEDTVFWDLSNKLMGHDSETKAKLKTIKNYIGANNFQALLNMGDIKDQLEKLEVMNGAMSMLGNTFSDFVGGLLGAGITVLLSHVTGIDGSKKVDANLENPVMVVFLEAVFIAIGCLIPVAYHFNSYGKGGLFQFMRVVIGVLVVLLFVGIGVQRDNKTDAPKKEPDPPTKKEKKQEALAFGLAAGMPLGLLVLYYTYALVSPMFKKTQWTKLAVEPMDSAPEIPVTRPRTNSGPLPPQ